MNRFDWVIITYIKRNALYSCYKGHYCVDNFITFSVCYTSFHMFNLHNIKTFTFRTLSFCNSITLEIGKECNRKTYNKGALRQTRAYYKKKWWKVAYIEYTVCIVSMQNSCLASESFVWPWSVEKQVINLRELICFGLWTP